MTGPYARYYCRGTLGCDTEAAGYFIPACALCHSIQTLAAPVPLSQPVCPVCAAAQRHQRRHKLGLRGWVKDTCPACRYADRYSPPPVKECHGIPF